MRLILVAVALLLVGVAEGGKRKRPDAPVPAPPTEGFRFRKRSSPTRLLRPRKLLRTSQLGLRVLQNSENDVGGVPVLADVVVPPICDTRPTNAPANETPKTSLAPRRCAAPSCLPKTPVMQHLSPFPLSTQATTDPSPSDPTHVAGTTVHDDDLAAAINHGANSTGAPFVCLPRPPGKRHLGSIELPVTAILAAQAHVPQRRVAPAPLPPDQEGAASATRGMRCVSRQRGSVWRR